MKPQIQAKLLEIRAKRSFNPEDWVNKKCEMLNEYMRRAGLKGVVVNVSGGIDSAVTIMLADKASKMPGSPIVKVYGIIQPIHSTPAIMKRAVDFLEASKLEYTVIDQSDVFDLLDKKVVECMKVPSSKFASGQLKSYMRTPVAYYAAQIFSNNGIPSLVIGTGNFDEDGYLYYFCKPGDGTSDIQLIHDLHKSEVNSVARFIGVSDAICVAPPSADLWEGQTDENELGFSYAFCELYVHLIQDKEAMLQWEASLDEDAKAQWKAISEKIERTHRRNNHKEKWPINLDICCPVGEQFKF